MCPAWVEESTQSGPVSVLRLYSSRATRHAQPPIPSPGRPHRVGVALSAGAIALNVQLGRGKPREPGLSGDLALEAGCAEWRPQESSAAIKGCRAFPGGTQAVVEMPGAGERKMGGVPPKRTALALGCAASLSLPARGFSGLPCRAGLLRAYARLPHVRPPRRFPRRLHPASSTPSCLPAGLALRPTSWVVAISVSLLDIISPISLQKSPLLGCLGGSVG